MQANQNRVFRRCLLLLSALAGILIAALILFAIILVVTIFNNKVIKKHVHY